MLTAILSHPACARHAMGPLHPESPARLTAIEDELIAARLQDFLRYCDAPRATLEQLLRVHSAAYLDQIEASAPVAGLTRLDPDTAMNSYSLEAALRAAGAAVMATDMVMGGEVDNAFCNVRPPGHHTTRDQAMGFCIFNNVAVGVAHALVQYGLQRVAIVDFDVHHGNGTEDIFHDDPSVMLCSTFQHPFYPHSGAASGNRHIINVALPAGMDGAGFRAVFRARCLPALEQFAPQMVFISAGFDAHREDDMAGLNLVAADYAWVTQQVKTIAQKYAHGRIVSTLEGGYALPALGRSAAAHIRVLAGL
ncbi:deacetylase [Sulfuriferula plumbiphila]|uniref:Deacetylase n=1 Tax=Sulfuriferula plumbiphila TaxID=171865 RepID=A0A512L642_9PROT|nr:histone deacetylase family protein [Sulfuriferula plumbiphila]BBP03548.1 deacetylase [Sulfuriferula plumbiphila]GEP29949.1 deacetylase [Sulfuriferula plumbiphila]